MQRQCCDAGGGGGSLGIVTSFTIKTYPAPQVTTIFQVNWDLTDLVPTMTWWQQQASHWPNELSSDFMAFSSNAQFAGNFAGSKAELMAILNSSGYQSLPSKQSEDFREMPYIDAALYNAVQSQGLKPADDIHSLGLGPGEQCVHSTVCSRSGFTRLVVSLAAMKASNVGRQAALY